MILGATVGAILAAGTLPSAAHAASRDVAALQAALRAVGTYAGPRRRPRGARAPRGAVARFQRSAGLASDGVAGPRPPRRSGRPRPARGSARGSSRWARRAGTSAALQFALQQHGFPSGPIDGGPRGRAALRRCQRFQLWAGLGADGVAGPATLAALRTPPPRSVLRFAPPVAGPIGDRYGPRGAGFHPGLDYPEAAGTVVRAAGRGCVRSAGWDVGGYGNLVVIAHRMGMTSHYAHLDRISVGPGRCVVAGDPIGTVGSTGRSTGPHLHFELRVRGALVDPLSGL
jgi:murein DD-endopeptidase MepM/ murein hydrolase activator NlpD